MSYCAIADGAKQQCQFPFYQLSDDMATAAEMPTTTGSAVPLVSKAMVILPLACNPSLPSMGDPLQYIDTFIGNFISLAQEPNLHMLHITLVHIINKQARTWMQREVTLPSKGPPFLPNNVA